MTRTLLPLLALTLGTVALADDDAARASEAEAAYAAIAERPPTRDAGADAVLIGWSTTYGGYVGGVTGYLAGEAMEEHEHDHHAQGIGPGVLAGLAIGGTSGWLLSRNRDVTMDHAAFLWSTSALGTAYGLQAGRALIPESADAATERVHAAGLAGSMAGVGYGFFGRVPSIEHQLHVALATGVGSFAAAGLSDAAGLTLADDRQRRAGINLAGMAAMGGVAAAYGRLADEAPNPGAWALGLGHGAWIGAMTPYLFTAPDEHADTHHHVGGMRAGVGAGYAGALAMAAIGNPTPRSVALQTTGALAGNALGGGIPLMLGRQPDTPAVVAPMLGSGVAGQALGAAVAPHYELTANDAVLLSTLGAWTGYQAAGWSAYAVASGQEPTRALGTALTTGGAGTLLAMGLAPALDVSPAGSAMLLSGGGWGTWYGGWTANLVGTSPDDGWAMMLASGDAALLGTAIAQGAGWKPTWTQVGLVDGMGLLGAAGGGLVGVIGLYEEDDWDPMVGSILVGSTVGLGAGVVLAAKHPGSGTQLPAMRVGRSRWQPSVSARPWTDDDGNPGVFAKLDLREL